MKKIVLLGDSIRMNYGSLVPSLLSDMTVWQPEDNCRFTSYTLRGVLHEWKSELIGADLIHFNCGAWDECDLGDGPFTPIDDYAKLLVRIGTRLKEYSPRVLFALTTPTRPENSGHSIDRIRAYNEAATSALSEIGIGINDLFTPVASDIGKYIRQDDLIHLTPDGISLCASLTAKRIREELV